ncbi:hypothetical protein T03_1355 [Trichinella britovi]|uniref:Uncharacterized protein n=1 Tax=Trichinella britovi TaxID=45882 RepID=A0A0V1CI80_TRIBR|nr:hypothetical protein T03_1355 [Trichinella britovi]
MDLLKRLLVEWIWVQIFISDQIGKWNNKMKAGNIVLCVNDKTVEIASFLHVSRLFVFLYSTDWSMPNHFVKIRSICGIKQYPNVSQMNLSYWTISFICSNECELYTDMKCAVQEFLSKLKELLEIQTINLIYASTD